MVGVVQPDAHHLADLSHARPEPVRVDNRKRRRVQCPQSIQSTRHQCVAGEVRDLAGEVAHHAVMQKTRLFGAEGSVSQKLHDVSQEPPVWIALKVIVVSERTMPGMSSSCSLR